jgi:hypothetical protein
VAIILWLTVTTSSHDPYPIHKDDTPYGDRAMFKIARFENSSRHSEILRIARMSAEIGSPNSEARLTGRSERLTFHVDSLLL